MKISRDRKVEEVIAFLKPQDACIEIADSVVGVVQGLLVFLAHSQLSVIDWLPKVAGTYGIHSCTGSGNDEFARNSV